MERITELKFQKLSAEELEDIQGGKLFGKVDTPIAGTSCVNSTAGCTQDWETTIYVFGIPIKKKGTTKGGCSNSRNVARGDASGCTNCGAC